MNYKNKTFAISLVTIIVVIIALFFGANVYIKIKLNDWINSLPKNIEVSYDDMDVNSFFGTIQISKLAAVIDGTTSNKMLGSYTVEYFKIADINYYDIFFKDRITVDLIQLDSVDVNHFYDSNLKRKSFESFILNKINKEVMVKSFYMNSNGIIVHDIKSDSVIMEIEDFKIRTESLHFMPNNSRKHKLPFKIENVLFNGNNIYYSLNSYDNITVDTLSFQNNNLKLQNTRLFTKYNRRKLGALLAVERDHFDVSAKTIQLDSITLRSEKNTQTFTFNAAALDVTSGKALIYRDKLVADNIKFKPLYSQMLRNLDFNFGIDSVNIRNSKIKYEEKVKQDNVAGEINFSNTNAQLYNLGNIYGDNETTLNLSASFMEKAPIKVDWAFRVQDTTDRFTFAAQIDDLDVSSINQFTVPNLEVRLKGNLDKTYFTVGGNSYLGNTDVKVKYDNFKIVLLSDDDKEPKSILSGLLNIFVAKNSEDNNDDFRVGEAENVERTINKSVFNFIWLNVREALKSAIMGDGEKES